MEKDADGRWHASDSVGLVQGVAPEARSLSIHGDRRPGLAITGPARLRFRMAVPRRGRFDFGVASRPVEAALRLRAEVRGEDRPLHEEVLKGVRGWSERQLDLARHAGRTIELDLVLDGGAESRAWLGAPALLGADATDAPNVLVYVVDCLRAESIGAYGYGRGTTPSIDALAREAALFEHAISCATWTKPAVGCLLSSRYPHVHGARTMDSALSSSVPVFPERFSDAGYATQAWVANPVLDAEDLGFGRGFDRYVELANKWKGRSVNNVHADAAEITDGVAAWLRLNRDRRFLMYLHSLDLHYPYESRAPFERLVTPGSTGLVRQQELYDAEIAYNDREIGKLITLLKELSLFDDTLLVVSADHGEEFGAHGFDRHGHSLFDQLLRVPLILKLPRGYAAGRRLGGLSGLLDVAPTLLDFAGLPALPHSDGVSLRAWLRRSPPPDRVRFAEQISPKQTLYAAQTDRLKYVRQLLPEPRDWLFDLEGDPGETRNLLESEPARGAPLRASLEGFMASALEGLHLRVTAPTPASRMRLRVSSPEGRIVEALRIVIRTGDEIQFEADRRGVVFSFEGKDVARHVLLRTESPDSRLEIELLADGRRLPAEHIILAAGAAPRALANPLRVRPAELARADASQGAPPELPAGHMAVWYEGLAPRIALRPELVEQMRALGYVQ